MVKVPLVGLKQLLAKLAQLNLMACNFTLLRPAKDILSCQVFQPTFETKSN